MYDDLQVGSIVLLMNDEMNIYNALIVQKEVIEDGRVYNYLTLKYPHCYVGVDSYSLIDEENIFDVIYDAKNISNNNTEICPGTVIEYQKATYLIIGKNVKYLGNDRKNQYAITRYNQDAYDIKYISENDIEKITSYGYLDSEYNELDNDRYNILNLALRRYRSFLPIGSVVELQTQDGNLIDAMIVGRNPNEEMEYHYVGVLYEPTYMDSRLTFNFNKDEIAKIKYIGYFNEQEKEENKKLLLKIMNEG